MKYFILFFCVSFSVNAQVSKQEIFRIDSLPKQGILLDKGWKWQAGDNPDFAKANFDDSAWESIDPTRTLPEQKEIDTEKPLWLRLRFKCNNTRTIALAIKQAGATEIFMNGKLIKAFGKIDTTNQNTTAYMPVNEYVLLPLVDSAENTLAVRYYFQKNINYFQFHDLFYPLFSCNLFDSNYLPTNLSKEVFIWEGFNVGVPFILFLIYFTIFLFYIPNKANLCFSLWGLCSFMTSFLVLEAKFTPFIALQNQLSFAAAIPSNIGIIFLFYSIYLLLNQRIKAVLWLFIAASILGFLYSILGGGNPRIANFILILLYIGLVIFMGLNAKNRGNKGGVYVIIGIVCFIVLWTIFIFDIGGNKSTIFAAIVYHLATLCLPIIVATLLGLETKNTNKTLLKQIDDIKILSTEKQQILSAQNETLEKQVGERTTELNKSLTELKQTQNQLIQKEKLASLGELTAGIAHEIQNPLNFVNNFSELSVELIEESPQPPEGANEDWIPQEAPPGGWGAFFSDLKLNLQKINLHGKRASSIVKGMLEHSRSSTGERVLTDINQLADEYLRLSYHGMRAKDTNFNANYKIEIDENLPKIMVVPQDIGRVLLNLMNNAFYAVYERNTVETLHATSLPTPTPTPMQTQSQSPTQSPTVTVSTRQIGNQVIISVKDNGAGIPENIKAKIFQPFFTTKPTGEGTGLGLSLSYDIITKGHGGTLEVISKEGKGAEFIIKLPI